MNLVGEFLFPIAILFFEALDVSNGFNPKTLKCEGH